MYISSTFIRINYFTKSAYSLRLSRKTVYEFELIVETTLSTLIYDTLKRFFLESFFPQ